MPNQQSIAGNTTRGISLGGGTSPIAETGQYLTISTLGNTSDFGEINPSANCHGGNMGSATRGCYTGTMSATNTISYVTIMTLGSSKDFGDMSVARTGWSQSGSTTRGVIAGAQEGNTNVAEYIQIASTGNAVDFGDLTNTYGYFSACSNGHGGL